MYKKGSIYKVIFLDHESEAGIMPHEINVQKKIEVEFVGKLLAEFDGYLVFVVWECPEGNDIYRIVKSCIIKIDELGVINDER